MHAKLYADLQQKIQEWVDEHCEENEWPDIIIGNKTVDCMTKVAASVFDACQESQEYAKREGYFDND